MIERLLAAFDEGAADGAAPRTTVGAEEIADILWLAARVDAAVPPLRPQDGPAAGAGPEPDPPTPPRAPAPVPGPTGAAGAGAVRLYPTTEPAAPADTAPPPAGAAPGTGGRRGVPLRLPRTASLDDPLALMRSLRPVGRRSIGGPGEELDEQLTVERSIESMVPTPVLRPAESRWLDLALVVDTHHSMLLWSDLVAELRAVLTRSGVFRDVRTWQLGGTGPGGTPVLGRGRGGPPRNPLELVDPAGRRLILVVSDTVADGWRQAPLRAVLRQWSTHNAVAVLNVLPERLWNRGAARPVPFAVRCDRPAAATRSWQRIPAARRARGGGPVVPVVGIASGSLARLVRVVSGDGRWRRLACLRLDSEPPPAAAPAAGLTALEAVERFRAAASPTAQQLAAHLAAVPLTLPVMTLVRRSLPVGSEHGHLAEVALGGLFAPWDAQHPADETEFEFLPGVRDVLLGSQLRGDVAAVRELVRLRVWEYLSRHRGTGPDFSATRVTDGTEGRRRVPDTALPFAERPRTEPGLAHRVVRVRFEPSPEPREVGTLLGPRTVLTAGRVARPADTVAWVRSGVRDVPCRPVWWDEATPRVLLLESEEDLADPADLPPLAWTTVKDRAVVDGATDQGDPVGLLAGVAPDDGGRNGELVRLSAEPEAWTHYRGGPVSHQGKLAGVVHGVWPDRMVFLSGAALLEDEAFRTALRTALGDTEALPPGTGGPGYRVAVTVQAGEVRPGSHAPSGPVSADLLRRLMADAGVAGRFLGGPVEERGVTVSLDAPGALEQAGRLLTSLARGGAGLPEGMARRFTMVLDIGPADRPPRNVGHLLVYRMRRNTAEWPPAEITVVLTAHLYELLGELLGPSALREFDPPVVGFQGSIDYGPPGSLADLLTRAEEARSDRDGWPRCGADAAPERPSGCAGVRVPGHSRCLAHLPPAPRDAYLGTLGPGSPLDFRGTTFAEGLLTALLDAVRDPRTGRMRLGPALFTGAVFDDGWEAGEAVFGGEADFTRALFAAGADFDGAAFPGEVSFRRADFAERAGFREVEFEGGADFRDAVFGHEADFSYVTWRQEICFRGAVVEGVARLHAATAHDTADLTHMVCKGGADLDAAVFMMPVSFAHSVWEAGLSADGTDFREPVFEHVVSRGATRFEHVHVEGTATFAHAVFEAEVGFHSCGFREPAVFSRADFQGPLTVADTRFSAGASFDGASFPGGLRWRRTEVGSAGASFAGALIQGPAYFEDCEFPDAAVFRDCAFQGPLTFEDARFGANLTLERVAFDEPTGFAGDALARMPGLPEGWTVSRIDGFLRIMPPPSPHPGET
ncbi:SAV_2336 N-terminal domain-related protein [Streptomyces sp. AB3(2024)]|uniref:SAV_2336 N-terminal domain-related protein n=1 Tax=Streptomyces sp. AB3(2024) TaxID=3317321 RepID=UPI0035A3604B